MTDDRFQSIVLAVTAFILLLQATFLATQVLLLRKDLGRRLTAARVAGWARVTEIEMGDSAIHRMMMPPKVETAVRHLSDDDLRRRAFAWFIFSMYQGMWEQEERAGDPRVVEDEIRHLLSNPRMRVAWDEWGVSCHFDSSVRYQSKVAELYGKMNVDADESSDSLREPETDPAATVHLEGR